MLLKIAKNGIKTNDIIFIIYNINQANSIFMFNMKTLPKFILFLLNLSILSCLSMLIDILFYFYLLFFFLLVIRFFNIIFYRLSFSLIFLIINNRLSTLTYLWLFNILIVIFFSCTLLTHLNKFLN